LLSNALKYASDNGTIKVEVIQPSQSAKVAPDEGDELEDHVAITISNTGKGIPKNQLEHIFKRFYSVKSVKGYETHGSGVGLEIVKKLVDLHKGSIEVLSEFDEQGVQGHASFVIKLKRGSQHFDDDDLLKDYRSSEDISHYSKQLKYESIEPATEHPDINEQESISDEKQHTILVVEDNSEVRKLVVDVFASDYHILEATNGIDGFEIASKEIPDLIISDIMMPGMDGIELCRKIKTNVNISHVPVVLLTARTAVTFKYTGLETGADDYIIKPFSAKYLDLRVTNLIQQRIRLKEHYGQLGTLIPADITLTSVGEKLMEKTVDFIVDNMENEKLTVAKIAEEVGMSRVHFYRKIKGLTNLSPVEFIRKLRMDRAGQLLRTNKLNVSEVRYKVGIADPDYFRKCFKEHFGSTPVEYLESFLSGVNKG